MYIIRTKLQFILSHTCSFRREDFQHSAYQKQEFPVTAMLQMCICPNVQSA